MMKDIRRLATVGAVALFAAAAPLSAALATTPFINLAPASDASLGIPDVLNHEPAPSLLGPVMSATRYQASPYGYTTRASGIHVVPTPFRVHKVANPGEVESLQRALDKDGADLKVDGVMGQRTDTALLNYQSDHGIAVTGRLDKDTKDMLRIA